MKLRNDILIVTFYLLCGFAWIYFSDILPEYSVGLANTKYQTYKGFFYVSLTALLLFLMLRSNNKLLDRSIKKLKKNQQVLRQSEEKYRLLYNESPGLKLIFDIESFRILDANKASCEEYGYTLPEFRQMSVLDLCNQQEFKNKIKEVSINDKILPLGLFPHTNKDGSVRIVDIMGHRLTFDNTPAVMLLSNDVTERTEVLRKLEDNQKKLSAAQKIAKIGYWQMSLENGTLFWSDEIYEIWGVDKATFTPHFDNFLAAMHPEDLPMFLEKQNSFQYNEEIFDFEHRIVRPDGSIRWVNERAKRHEEEEGRLVYLEGTTQDITEQKLAAIAIEEISQRYQYLTKATFDTVWDWDLSNNNLTWGEGFFKVFGYNPDVVKDDIESWSDNIYKADYDRIISGIQNFIDSDELIWHDTYRYKKAEGEYVTVQDRAYAVRDKNGKAVRLVGAMQDITEAIQKTEQKEFLAKAIKTFAAYRTLDGALCDILKQLVEFGDFKLAEAWMVDGIAEQIQLETWYSDTPVNYYNKQKAKNAYNIGEGLPGIAWATKTIQHWTDVQEQDLEIIKRQELVAETGINAAIGLPLIHNDELLGVLIFGYDKENEINPAFFKLAETIQYQLGSEIRNKQREEQMDQIFNFAPDMICVMGNDGLFRRINPSGCSLLEYSQDEIIGKQALTFIHPDDLEHSTAELASLASGNSTINFENRFISKTGKVFWFSWTATPYTEKGLLFCIGKNITDKKILEQRLTKAHDMARIGVWEIDMEHNDVFWSDMTKLIHEVPDNFKPDFDSTVNFFSGDSKERIVADISEAIQSGKAFDNEYQIITHKGKKIWVRLIGEAEFAGNKCVRIYGSMQDVTDRHNYTHAIEQQNRQLLEIAWIQSHEVRAPLASIMGLVMLIKEGNIEARSEDLNQVLSDILSSAKDLDTVIRKITQKANYNKA